MDEKNDIIALLRVAMSLEALTIPPYMTAYWSIKDNPTTKDNQEAKKIIHSVAMEEMLHMMSVGNIIAALGACPLYYNKCNTLEKWGEDNLPILGFPVDLAPFSKKQIDKFLEIEKPVKPIDLAIKSIPITSEFYENLKANISTIRGLEQSPPKIELIEDPKKVPVKEILKIKDYNEIIVLKEVKKLLPENFNEIIKLIGSEVNIDNDDYILIPICGNENKILIIKLSVLNEAFFIIDPNEDKNLKLPMILNIVSRLDNDLSEISFNPELKSELDKCKTIGEFYTLVIKELNKLDDNDFNSNIYKQLDLSHDPRVGTIEQRTIPSFIVDSKEKAVKLLEWVVDQGEGSEVPMDNDGELAHYYRFKQITKGYYIEKDDNGLDCFNYNKPFQVEEDEIYVRHKYEVKSKSEEDKLRKQLSKNFNEGYFNMFKELQSFYLTGERRYIMQSFDYMMKMSTNAEILMDSGAYPNFKFEN